MTDQRVITVYYDGVCNLCYGIVNTMNTSSKRNMFVPIDVSDGALPAGLTKEAVLRDVHVVDAEGKMRVGVDGVLTILEQYPRLHTLARIGRVPGIHALAAGIYRIIERSRYWIFGRKNV